jgi:ABC-2 type transport system ATP-binding protein
MTPETSPAIEMNGLRKVYGDKAAVDGLTLTVERGCFFGFLGPNGAGKTTTIRMLMGLAPPTAGTIRILGRRMPEQHLEIKARIGLVPDESLLFDHLTGFEFVEFVGRMYGLGRELSRRRARELMELFELDEPFEGVDAVGARLMKDILLEQVAKGATIFLTSHVLEVVERLCDRVAIIHQGKLVAEGPIEALRSGEETLEDLFVRIVGGPARTTEALDWLR